MADSTRRKSKPIVLTSHPRSSGAKPIAIDWGNSDPIARGPVIATLTNPAHRNVIGTHSGSYAIYRALAVARQALNPEHRADLTNTAPVADIGPHSSWTDRDKIVSLDPFGARVGDIYTQFYEQGIDIRPTIAITQAHINMPELQEALSQGRLHVDGQILKEGGDLVVVKAAIEPVWYLPGIAKRIGVEEMDLPPVCSNRA